jgi:hypothetical protein
MKDDAIMQSPPAAKILPCLMKPKQFATVINTSLRTVAELQRQGLPHLKLNGARQGRILIDAEEGIAWMKSKFSVQRMGKFTGNNRGARP